MQFNISVNAPKATIKQDLEAQIASYDAVKGYNVMQHIWPAVEPLIADYKDTDTISIQVAASDTSAIGHDSKFRWNLGVTVI